MQRYNMFTPDPVQDCKILPHFEYPSGEVNPFGQICQELMIKTFYPVCVSALY